MRFTFDGFVYAAMLLIAMVAAAITFIGIPLMMVYLELTRNG